MLEKLKSFIADNILEIYTIVLLFLGVPGCAFLFFGWEIGLTVFVVIQIPFLLIKLKKDSDAN